MAEIGPFATLEWANMNSGSPLPAARTIVVGVPALALLIYWWLRQRGDPK
ncbi:MAG TPA: hypothetical protein VND83_03815 [Acidimicrobiales bacterium]|nr:hypothetical protein [Acidimicrobiales bacterium]